MRASRFLPPSLIALLAVGVAPTSGAPQPRDPRVLSATFDGGRVEAGRAAVLRVRVKDPGAAVNGIQVDFGDGRGAFATSACRPGGRAGAPVQEAFRADATLEFHVSHVYLEPGDYELKLTAKSGDCVSGPLAVKRRMVVKVSLPKGPAVPPAVKARPAQAGGCPGAETIPTAANRLQIKVALRCVVNAVRAQRGLRALGANAKLTRAAKLHSDDMVARGYFAHESPGGVDLSARLRRVKYRPAAGGENIAAGTDILSTPLVVVQGWLDSPPHRENMLGARFEEVGVGVALGFPEGRGEGATYTMTFGARR